MLILILLNLHLFCSTSFDWSLQFPSSSDESDDLCLCVLSSAWDKPLSFCCEIKSFLVSSQCNSDFFFITLHHFSFMFNLASEQWLVWWHECIESNHDTLHLSSLAEKKVLGEREGKVETFRFAIFSTCHSSYCSTWIHQATYGLFSLFNLKKLQYAQSS